jgi:hypothetical protein
MSFSAYPIERILEADKEHPIGYEASHKSGMEMAV